MRYNEQIRKMPSSPIREWTKRLRDMGTEIQLTLGEPAETTPKVICEAACQSLRQGNTHYPPAAGQDSLREALARRQHQKTGWPVKPEQILITSGAQEALGVLCLGLLNPGDEVLIQDPAYPGYIMTAALAHAVCVSCPMTISFQPSPEVIEKRITPKTRAIILNTPCNPTGRSLDSQRLVEIAALAQRYDLVLILDVVYEDLAWPALDLSVLRPYRSQLALVSSFSKPYAMTGWRIGMLTAPVRWMEVLTRTHQFLMSGVPGFIQDAALAALDEDTSEVSARLERSSKKMWQALSQAGLDCPYPQGTFYLFPNIRKTGLDGEEFALKLARDARVSVLPGSLFGSQGRWHVRLSVTGSSVQLDEAARRIQRVVSGRKLQQPAEGQDQKEN